MSLKGDAPAAAQGGVMRDRRELALVAVERTRMPMVVTDALQADYPIVLANQAFLDLTGYTSDEVLGRNCRFLQGPGTSQAALEEIRRGLQDDEHFVRVELLNYRKDGSVFLNQLSISPVHDENGTTIYHFASQEDASARRRAEELEAVERLLLMEVDHRSMDALALVESFLAFTPTDDISRFSKTVRDRVGAIARAHRLLAESSWTGVELHELVSALAPPNVQANGSGVRLPANLVQPLALALNELILNVSQNDERTQRETLLALTWEAAPDRLTFLWSEAGLNAANPDRDLDFKLLRAIVERQLSGAAFVEAKAGSLEVQLVVPVMVTANV